MSAKDTPKPFFVYTLPCPAKDMGPSALVFSCIDNRLFPEAIRALLERQYGIKYPHIMALAGGSSIKDEDEWNRWPILSEVLEILQHKRIRQIFAFCHQDCAYHGGSGRFASDNDERYYHQDRAATFATLVSKALEEISSRDTISLHVGYVNIVGDELHFETPQEFTVSRNAVS